MKIIQHVFDGSEAYTGPLSDEGPDMLLVPENGYDLKGRIGADDIVGARRLQGMHTWDDAFFYSRRSDLLPERDGLTIFDVTEKITRSLDVDA